MTNLDEFVTYGVKTGKGESMLIKKEQVYSLANEMANAVLGVDSAYYGKEGTEEVLKQLECISDLAKVVANEIKDINNTNDNNGGINVKHNIHTAKGDTNLEVVNNVEGKGVLTVRLSNGEFELNRSLSENQLAKLIGDLQSYHTKLQNDKVKVAAVSFYGIEGSVNTKNYYFLTNIKDLKSGDYVFVDSAGTHCVGKFVKYIDYPAKQPTKYIIRRAQRVVKYV